MRGQLGQVYEKQLVSRVRSFKNTNHRISLFSVVQYEIKVGPLGLSCIRAKSRASSACFKTIRKFAFCDKLWKEGDVLLHSRLSCRRVSRYIRAELLYHAECSRSCHIQSLGTVTLFLGELGAGWLWKLCLSAMKDLGFTVGHCLLWGLLSGSVWVCCYCKWTMLFVDLD